MRIHRRHRSGRQPVDATKTLPTTGGTQRAVNRSQSPRKPIEVTAVVMCFRTLGTDDATWGEVLLEGSVHLLLDRGLGVVRGTTEPQCGRTVVLVTNVSTKAATPYERYRHGPYRQTPELIKVAVQASCFVIKSKNSARNAKTSRRSERDERSSRPSFLLVLVFAALFSRFSPELSRNRYTFGRADFSAA